MLYELPRSAAPGPTPKSTARITGAVVANRVIISKMSISKSVYFTSVIASCLEAPDFDNWVEILKL